jgi:tetratricopeptide (TPR) repeat protein
MIESVERYQKVLEMDPRNTEALNGMANAFAAQDKFAEAESCFLRALEIDPRNTEAMNGMGALAWRKRAHWYNTTKDHRFAYEMDGSCINEAKKWYEKVLSIDPNNAIAIEAKERTEEAKFNLERAIFSQEHDI